MKKLFFLLALISLFTACAAPAGSSNRLPTAEEVEAFNLTAEYDDQIVCRFEVLLGSAFRNRVCLTRRVMAERDQQMNALLDQQRDDSLQDDPT